MKTILAPIDFSGVTEAVLAQATLLARSLDARVVLMTVIQPPKVIAEYAPLLQDIAEITIAGEKAAAAKLSHLQEKLQNEFITCETVQLVGAPIVHILAEAKRTDADYIVMGSHGHTALYDLLVGSTTHGVLSQAACPVLVVPASGSRKKAKETRKRTVAA
jgi:nucleotide-binding universal stress UspA family protein